MYYIKAEGHKDEQDIDPGFLKIDLRDREKEREQEICCSTYLCIHWFFL